MAKETSQVELTLEQVNRVWELFHEVSKKGQRRAIAEKTGLPLATVRAVLFGQYEVRNGVAIVRVPNADHTVEIGGRVVAGRMKLIGTVLRPPQYVIRRGNGCSLKIDVDGETFEVLVTKGRKPWTVAVGSKVGAVGMLKGTTLWADDWWRLSPPAKPEATRLQ